MLPQDDTHMSSIIPCLISSGSPSHTPGVTTVAHSGVVQLYIMPEDWRCGINEGVDIVMSIRILRVTLLWIRGAYGELQ